MLPPALEAALRSPETVRRLNLRDLDLSTLPPEVRRLTGLEVLDLSFNPLAAVPEVLAALPSLKRLGLSGCPLGSLEGIGRLTGLTRLRVGGWVPATVLPPEIGRLTALRDLDLSGLSLTALPPEIGRLSALESLTLSGPLEQLPALPSGLRHLKIRGASALDLSVVCALRSLSSLIVTGCGLTTLPPEIGQLSALTALELDDNPLTGLPAEIGRLSALVSLSAARAALSGLPEEIGSLCALEELSLSGNALSSLPESIGRLSALRDLDLSDNHLHHLPPSLQRLPALEQLRLTGNTFPPADIAALQRWAGVTVDLPDPAPPVRLLQPDERPLDPAVLSAIAALGGHLSDRLPPPVATLRGVMRPLPRAARQLMATRWPEEVYDSPIGEIAALSLAADIGSATEGYAVTRSGDWLEVAVTAEHSVVLVSLDDPQPGNPAVCYLQHGQFSSRTVRELGCSLAEFLRQLAPAGR